MHPALSVIFFTVISGAGFGFMTLIGLGWPMPDNSLMAFLICLLAGGLSVIGLISSTFHLGHPERAWRAFSQWRSSWLSREGVISVFALSLFGIYALVWMITGHRINWLGFVIAFLSLTTVYATSMIYAQLKTVPAWHNNLTPFCYLAFALTSGFFLVSTFGIPYEIIDIPVTRLSVIFLIIAWGLKLLWWYQAGRIGFSKTGSDTGTATGLGYLGKVRLFEKPHSGENYLTKEMMHQIGRKHARKLRIISILFGLLVPLILSTYCDIMYRDEIYQPFMFIGFISMVAGLFVERWLFFAEAKHAVSLYY